MIIPTVLCFLRFDLVNKFIINFDFLLGDCAGALFRGKNIGTDSKLLIADNFD